MRLPNSEQAVLDLRKIEDYCLNHLHPRGRHKARVFRRVLDIERSDAEWLRLRILEGLRESDATETAHDEIGSRWRIDISVERHGRLGVVRTVWMIGNGEHVPRFVTCWVL